MSPIATLHMLAIIGTAWTAVCIVLHCFVLYLLVHAFPFLSFVFVVSLALRLVISINHISTHYTLQPLKPKGNTHTWTHLCAFARAHTFISNSVLSLSFIILNNSCIERTLTPGLSLGPIIVYVLPAPVWP